MKFRIIVSTLIVFLSVLIIQLIVSKTLTKQLPDEETIFENEEKEEKSGAYQYLRWKYEADMIRDPTTGEIPFGLRDQEIEFAKTIPARGSSSALSRVSAQNTYLPAGPNNIGGRTRALAYDIRYNGSTNRVIIAGCVSGGIFRTADGGANWTRVSPNNEVHNVACVVQDPRTGNQNTWYAGGGEYVGSSTNATGAEYLGYGLFKSSDNGVTWTRLPLNNITDINGSLLPSGVPERFDHPFDYVHKIAVNPLNGDVYVAGHRRVMRSTNGGTTFQTVFGSTVAAFGENGQCDVVVSPTGKVYIAMTGSAADLTLRGIWRSTTGNQNSFTRLAGGNVLGTDSVSNWRGNAYKFVVSGGSNFYDGRRTLIALAPSNENILYVLYENGLSNASPNFDKEADLFKLDMTSGNTWTNLSANLPDFDGNSNQEATDPFAVQNGYDLFITVKPNDPNFVILGGSSLYRSTNGFSNVSGTAWIGGYGNTLPNVSLYGQTSSPGDPSRWSHPDIHNLAFNPSNSNEAICANDGGLQITSNIAGTASGNEPVAWTVIKNYQTLQYFKITIDPEIGANNFVGGSQDNGTQFRDKTGILGVAVADSNNHRRLITADGGSVGISKRVNARQILYGSFQLGNIRRGVLQTAFSSSDIQPDGLTPVSGSTSEFGEFVTNFKLDPDNTEDLYYVNFNRLFRTTSASTVSSSSWIELTGVSNAINPNNGTNISIRALALSRGDYTSSHALYMGTTDGRVFRLDGPRNSPAVSMPVNISPPGINGLNIQDISVNPNNDNEILMVVSNYGITLSNTFFNVVNIWWTNNAKSASPTWYEAEGNLAGSSSAGFVSARSCMIVVKKDAANNPVTEYYVGTSAGLFSVENLGTTLLANGTPNWQREAPSLLNFSVINSIAYRPGDNVMAIGTHGNGLYYTFLGTPNLVTAVTDPVINDKTFIALVYPTISNNIVQYKVGNKFDVKNISIQLLNMQGQVLYKKQENYSDGSLNLERYAKGAYILSIYSDNQKYKHVQKIIHN